MCWPSEKWTSEDTPTLTCTLTWTAISEHWHLNTENTYHLSFFLLINSWTLERWKKLKTSALECEIRMRQQLLRVQNWKIRLVFLLSSWNSSRPITGFVPFFYFIFLHSNVDPWPLVWLFDPYLAIKLKKYTIKKTAHFASVKTVDCFLHRRKASSAILKDN